MDHQILIERKSAMIGSLKTYTVYIDGAVAGKLRNGGTLAIHTDEGQHTLTFVAFKRAEKVLPLYISANEYSVQIKAKLSIMSGKIELSGFQPASGVQNAPINGEATDDKSPVANSSAPSEFNNSPTTTEDWENAPGFFGEKALTPDEYSEMREQQVIWLESHYDLSTREGINSIPAKKGLPRPPFGGVTGDIDYYLRGKGFEYEDAGNIELAILCLKKSNEIRMVCRKGYRRDDYYSYVRLLARSGYVEEAKSEKAKIDKHFEGLSFDDDGELSDPSNYTREIVKRAQLFETDLVMMTAHNCACPECAKYQGRVFSLSGKSRIFPKIPDAFWKYGGIHRGCGHGFHPYIHGVDNPHLDEILSVQKISDKRYTRNIVTFSNRPFVDDRPEADVLQSLEVLQKRRQEAEHQQHLWDEMIDFETARGIEKRKYKWIQENLPDICPKSYSGYRRMKLQNTKNYQKLRLEAQKLGKEI